MMVGMRLKGLVVILLLGVLLLSSNFSSCNARRGKHWRKSGYHRSGGGAATRATLFKKKTQSTYKGSGGSSKSKMKHGSSSSKQVPPAPSMGVAVPPSLPPSAPPPPPPLHYSPSPSPSHSTYYPSPSPSHSHYNYNPSPAPAPTAKSSKSPPTSSSPSSKAPLKPPPSSKAPLKSPPTSSPSSKVPFKPPPTGGSHSLPPPPLKRSSSRFYPPPPPPKSNPNGKAKPTPSPATEDAAATVFSVLDFGANGDGTSDDTKAFQAAWAAACKVEASTVLVPPEYTFLVGPISFSGPYCQPNIVFQLEGTIIAPTSAKAWGSGLLQWLEFTKLRGITIQGGGVIEGRGAVWWSTSQFDFMPISNELASFMPRIKPTALRFYGSYNVTVTGITIQNSPQCHLKFDSCQAVEAYNITISSPADSLNTDGIHLQNSKDVSIHHNTLGCGDDCVSIQTGCTNININHITCGPGHGISIGGLGRDNTKACVSNITVQNVDLSGTMTGVRIKTWQGGSGSVQNVRFSNIRVDQVQTPIVIDQFYCDRATCRNQTAAVAVQGVSYQNVRGTFTVKPVHMACSDSTPCSDITLDQIQLQPVQERYRMFMPFCWQAYGQLRSPTLPPIPIQIGKPARNELLSDPDTCVL